MFIVALAPTLLWLVVVDDRDEGRGAHHKGGGAHDEAGLVPRMWSFLLSPEIQGEMMPGRCERST